MKGDAAASSEQDARPLPPATTRWSDEGTAGDPDGSILPPFFGPRTGPGSAAPAPEESAASGQGAGSGADEFDEIPTEAFYIPEDTAPASAATGESRIGVEALAQRLEDLSTRLRREGAAALEGEGSGDRLDTLLRTLLAGYLAGRDG